MKAIPEEEKSNSTMETVATSIGNSPNPMSKPVTSRSSSTKSVRVSSSSARSGSTSSRTSSTSGANAALVSRNGLDPAVVQKSLQSELQQWKDMYHKQQREMQHRIDTLEQENTDLKQEQDILNDRHQSHTEELRYMQNEFLCIKGHLNKLRNDMESLDGLLIDQQLQQRQQKRSREEHQMAEKVEEAIFKVKERQEFTCVFMDNTISSIDEILNEYIPDKVQYADVEDHKTTEEVIQEAKLREMREEEELRQRRELEKQLMEQLKQEADDAQLVEDDGDAQDSNFTSSSSQLGNSVSSTLALQFPDEHLSELGIETPAVKEAKLSQEAQHLFKEQHKMFAKYIAESRSDVAETEPAAIRFKGWFEEKREKWREEENMKELRQKKSQSQAVMMHKVKQMHSETFHKVTEIKLHHHEQAEEEKERRSTLLKIDGEDKNGMDGPGAVPEPAEDQVSDLPEEEALRFSMNKGNLNDYFKQYKDHSQSVGGGLGPQSLEPKPAAGGGFLSMVFGVGKSENELSC
ncbi:unnamed protein product [Cylindrotheca closterium]|uniref:Uncharacterized protein n=1 Tax=Cylindrotheca closterium TaxID=2856 RepID=A0AAD2FIW6_9STRA|nr:unnamed protein product [Cylindrotheca closterium]